MLLQLCEELGLRTSDPKKPTKSLTKAALLGLLGQWRTDNGYADTQGNLLGKPVDIAPSGLKEQPVVLGRAILEEAWEDQAKLTLPSFVLPAPTRFGSEKRKLTADQWRSVGMMHLVITLVRLWGDEQGRMRHMLNNYMHLVTAIYIGSLRTTSRHYAGLFTKHFKLYLEGVVELYKEGKIQSVHHSCLHFEPLLLGFGPVHAWRAWAFERYNYLLQQTKTNMRFGELELTFMNDACRAANLASLLTDSNMSPELKDLWPAFQKAFLSDRRGTRLSDSLAFAEQGGRNIVMNVAKSSGRQAAQHALLLPLALKQIEAESPQDIIWCDKLQKDGLVYQPKDRSHRDSNAIVRLQSPLDGQDHVAAQIIAMFKEVATGNIFVIVARYCPLRQADAAHDRYRQFGIVAGRLYYAQTLPPSIIHATDLVTLFAMTPFKFASIKDPVIHVLPLYKDLLGTTVA